MSSSYSNYFCQHIFYSSLTFTLIALSKIFYKKSASSLKDFLSVHIEIWPTF